MQCYVRSSYLYYYAFDAKEIYISSGIKTPLVTTF